MSASDSGKMDSAGAEPAFHQEVDASGLNCPLPILKAKKALSQMASGEVLHVITTDPNAVRDFQAFCRQTGNALLAQLQQEGRTRHFLQRR